eukprot:3453182-Amphidinium_carterae.1
MARETEPRSSQRCRTMAARNHVSSTLKRRTVLYPAPVSGSLSQSFGQARRATRFPGAHPPVASWEILPSAA